MKKKLHLFALLMILGIFSCAKKEDDLVSSEDCQIDCIEIVGKIMTDNGTVPISDLDLTLQWDNSYFGSGIIRTKAKTRTNSDGRFYFNFKIRNDELLDGRFYIVFKLAEEVYLEANLSGIDLDQIARDTTLIINHNIPRIAYLNLTALNLNEIKQLDYFSAQFDYQVPNGYSQNINGQIRSWNYESNNNNNLIQVSGNQPIIVSIYRRKNDVLTVEYDTLLIDVGKTVNYTIDFSH
ncbi:hypothetical protein ACNR9Q_14535 [Maribacter sp. X9]|uniref:hypothetical protein n=1 Tax=Maribacter sp. X9 TaxID=3402159 RepID=UPI003AF3FBBB